MSVEVLPISGRVALAEKVAESTFLFAVSRGDPAWDSQWTEPNPPVPSLDSTDVLDLITYARPTVVSYLVEDDAGQIIAEGGARYSVSEEPTRFVRVRLSLSPGTIEPTTIREIGLFIDPVIDPSVSPGAIIVPADKVTDPGRLYTLFWCDRFPVSEGTYFASNFVVRL